MAKEWRTWRKWRGLGGSQVCWGKAETGKRTKMSKDSASERQRVKKPALERGRERTGREDLSTEARALRGLKWG